MEMVEGSQGGPTRANFLKKRTTFAKLASLQFVTTSFSFRFFFVGRSFCADFFFPKSQNTATPLVFDFLLCSMFNDDLFESCISYQ